MPEPDPDFWDNLGGSFKAASEGRDHLHIKRHRDQIPHCPRCGVYGQEPFHRRGHHVQKAHGRRLQMASDTSHHSGGMIALMPTAADAKRLALKGGEAAAELHCTLFFLGDDGSIWTEDQRNELEALVRSRAEQLPPLKANVFGVAHWNGNAEKPSWVWSVGDNPDAELADSSLHEAQMTVQDALESTHERPEIPHQHTPWVAHICAAYTDDLTLVRELEKRLGPVTFDRIRLSFGDDDRDIPLAGTAVSLTAAAPLQREPTETELACATDFASVHQAWETATASAVSALNAITQNWRAELKEQIIEKLDDDNPEALPGLSLDTLDATAALSMAMEDFAKRSGQTMQREAEKQGVEIPEWSIPEDVVTAAVGGRRLLESVAQMSSDLMATNLITAAKRKLSGLLSVFSSPEQIAAEVDQSLASADDNGIRSAVGVAMTTAQNVGRRAVLEVAPLGEYYSSEILDKNTCAPCKAVDGEQFGSLEIAIKAYPVMGYKDCVGPRYGNSCRGMIVARWQQSETASGIMSAAGDGDQPEGDTSMATATEEMGGKPNEGTKKDKRLKENEKTYADEKGNVVMEFGEDPDEEPDKVELSDNTAPWRGPLTVEGIETGDGREFDVDSLTWADLPLPLRWNRVDSHGGQPSTEAVNVGNITRIWREDSLIMGEGLLDLGDEDGQRVHDKIKGQFLRGVSVDVDSIKDADVEFVWADQPDEDGEGPDPFDLLFASPEKQIFHKGRIRAATIVDIPAFAEAYIALLDEEGAVVAGGVPIGAARATKILRPAFVGPVLRASGAGWSPPADWFSNPDLSVPTGITIDDQGRVYGHAALWGTCHIGQEGVCVTPPQEDSHPYFMTGEVVCADGSRSPVGQITVGTGHAPISYGANAASDHYDNTGAAVADVSVGNDAHGIWVAGALRPGVDSGRVHELRAAGQVSGDWRRIGGSLRLVGLLGVNVPGFPVPKIKTRINAGSQFSLVAAGIPRLTESVTEAQLDQWAMRRMLKIKARRVHGEE